MGSMDSKASTMSNQLTATHSEDLAAKVALLSYYVESVSRIACAIPDVYLARVYGRSLFLGVDAFLKWCYALKNELKKVGVLSPTAAEAITDDLVKLRNDYDGDYAKVRDKLVAHQQEIGLMLLLQAWNEIDETTLTILSEDIANVWSAFRAHGVTSTFPRLVELDDASMLDPFTMLVTADHGPRMGMDRVAQTKGIDRKRHHPLLDGSRQKTERLLSVFPWFQACIGSGLLHQSTAAGPRPKRHESYFHRRFLQRH